MDGSASLSPGDSLRQVHWAQTARRDQLVVFERQSRARQQVSIWLDCVAACSSKSIADDLIRAIASISNHFVNHSWAVRVNLDGNWQVLQPGKQGRQTWMDKLLVGRHNHLQRKAFFPTAQKGGLTIGIKRTLVLKRQCLISPIPFLGWFYPSRKTKSEQHEHRGSIHYSCRKRELSIRGSSYPVETV